MASNTENLNLLMKNPSTDGADTFNIQTMLNENWQKIDNNAGTVAKTLANILKPTTPPLIGLPPSTTPDGMFQALGNTGELHVWRKTVVTTEPVQAGYTIGEKISLSNNRAVLLNGNGADTISVSSSISVDENSGKVTLGASLVYSIWNTTANIQGPQSQIPVTELAGKYFVINKGTSYPNIPSNLTYDTVYYIPQNATCGYDYNWVTLTDLRMVNGHPYIPAGTTTTYPVSTNPNAYQEGDDAKEAWYVVGDVVTGKFGMGMRYASIVFEYSVASEISASDDGTISLKNPTTFTIGSSSGYPGVAGNVTAAIAGKYIQLKVMGSATSLMSGPFSSAPSSIVYIPPDTIATREDIKDGNTQTWYFIDRYQPVTGYAAIPAGTTIEYLGKLGDKARVQVVSYVGTGTYGKDNPNMLQLPFEPKYVIVQCLGDYGLAFFAQGCTRTLSLATSSGTRDIGCSWPDAKTLKWYGTDDSYRQLNASGVKYVAIIIG